MNTRKSKRAHNARTSHKRTPIQASVVSLDEARIYSKALADKLDGTEKEKQEFYAYLLYFAHFERGANGNILMGLPDQDEEEEAQA